MRSVLLGRYEVNRHGPHGLALMCLAQLLSPLVDIAWTIVWFCLEIKLLLRCAHDRFTITGPLYRMR